MIANYDSEIEKKYHQENFEDAQKVTVFDKKGNKKLEFGKIGRGKFKYGLRRFK